MKKIDKQKFDRLLKEDKDAALKMLCKDNEGHYLDEVVIGGKNYKIFSNIPDDLFTSNATKHLPKDYAALILCDVNYEEKEVLRADFNSWYFIGLARFYKSKFYEAFFTEAFFNVAVDFTESEFKQISAFSESNFNSYANFTKAKFSDVWFRNVNFNNHEVTFLETAFSGYTCFYKANFKSLAFFWGAKFSDEANFSNAKFNEVSFQEATFGKELLFTDAIFKEHCNLRVEKFADFVDFTGADYMRPLSINGKKLYENEKEYSKPTKLIFKDKDGKEDLEKTKRNLHNLKKIYNRLEYYDGEDHIYYWYKVFERKIKYCESFDNEGKLNWQYRKKVIEKLKRIRNNKEARKRTAQKALSLCFLWVKFRYLLLEKIILDKCTGYFTKPWNVFRAIVLTILSFCILYFFTGSIRDTGTKLFIEHFGKTLYFSAITFSTIGYGDYQPVGFWTMFLAAVEGIIGVLLMSTFLVTLTRKYLR